MPERADRLLVLAHGPTTVASALVFADTSPLLGTGTAPVVAPRAGSWSSGPEPACRQTLEVLGEAGPVHPALAGPDLGAWSGRALADVAAVDPQGVQAWLVDPDARPHGGETLTALVARVGAVLAEGERSPGPRSVVVAPLVARALVVAALGAPAAVLPGVDVGHGGQVLLSHSGSRWRLQELRRHPASGPA